MLPNHDGTTRQCGDEINPANCDPNAILFKHDRFYPHSLMRINYTTYDVRRSQDVVNASTSHCNIMVLAECDVDPTSHPHRFRYARVLGIYHANVIYVGPGMVDYQPRRMEFLWVRWYNVVNAATAGWDTLTLDRVEFPNLSEDDACGFINPSDVLRSSHIIPAFARGRCSTRVVGKDMSLCAKNSSDYIEYFVDR